MKQENAVSIYFGPWRIWGEPMKSAISTPCGPFGLLRKTINTTGMPFPVGPYDRDDAPDKPTPSTEPPAEEPPAPKS